MRTIIKANYGEVLIAYDNASGDRIHRAFSCPSNGGYVREVDQAQTYPQVCEKLSRFGYTLTSPSRDALIDVIRHEYRAMRRAQQRDRDKFDRR